MPRADDTDPTRALRQARFRDRKKERTDAKDRLIDAWRDAWHRTIAARSIREAREIAAEALSVEEGKE
jgi:hypothetical protein